MLGGTFRLLPLFLIQVYNAGAFPVPDQPAQANDNQLLSRSPGESSNRVRFTATYAGQQLPSRDVYIAGTRMALERTDKTIANRNPISEGAVTLNVQKSPGASRFWPFQITDTIAFALKDMSASGFREGKFKIETHYDTTWDYVGYIEFKHSGSATEDSVADKAVAVSPDMLELADLSSPKPPDPNLRRAWSSEWIPSPAPVAEKDFYLAFITAAYWINPETEDQVISGFTTQADEFRMRVADESATPGTVALTQGWVLTMAAEAVRVGLLRQKAGLPLAQVKVNLVWSDKGRNEKGKWVLYGPPLPFQPGFATGNSS